MKIVFIHGANSTSKSFNYIRSQLPEHTAIMVEYSTEMPLAFNIDEIRKSLPDDDFHIIAHSLGGIIAITLANILPNVKKVITMSSPFGGSGTADLLKWVFPQNQMFKDINSSSSIITRLVKPTADVLSIVSTSGGIPIIPTKNDGVVSVSSQKAIPNLNYIEVDTNHFEILLDNHVIDLIKIHLDK